MTNIHDGHRKRMRERFRESGLEGFAPHEVLELLLFYGRARGDTNPLAHALLDHFGSLQGVLEADPKQLMSVEGIGEESATLISLLLPLFRYYGVAVAETKQKITTKTTAVDYCSALLSGERKEKLYLISLSADGTILGRRLISEGSVGEVSANSRAIVETSLQHNAVAVVLCHNHPSGNMQPSAEDIEVTRQLQMLLNGLHIVLLDHIIISGVESYSMAQHGDFGDALYAE